MKSKSLGYGFAQFLGIAEYAEKVIKEERTAVDARYMGDVMDQVFNQVYRESSDKEAWEFISDLINRWGNMAAEVRKSFKFRTESDVLIKTEHIPTEGVFRMPFEFTSLIVEHDEAHVVLFIDERVSPEWVSGDVELPPASASPVQTAATEDMTMNQAYEKLGMGPGKLFYSITIGQFAKEKNAEGTGIYPIEVHIPMDAPMGPDMPVMYAYPVPRSIDPEALDRYANVATVLAQRFITMLNHRAIKQTSSAPGLKPGVAHGPKRAKQKYRHFEHTTVLIDPTYAPAEGDCLPSGRHHRLHPVRGFWRHYKNGKTTWVKAHWRGDKDLGVIHHDYEVKNGKLQDR